MFPGAMRSKSSWHGPQTTRLEPWSSHANAIKSRLGKPATGIKPKATLAYSSNGGRNTRGDTPRFSPLERAEIVELTCLESPWERDCKHPVAESTGIDRRSSGGAGARKPMRRGRPGGKTDDNSGRVSQKRLLIKP